MSKPGLDPAQWVVRRWHESGFADEPTDAKKILAKASIPFRRAIIRAAGAQGVNTPSANKFGRWLSAHKDEIILGYRIRFEWNERWKQKDWYLEPLSDQELSELAKLEVAAPEKVIRPYVKTDAWYRARDEFGWLDADELACADRKPVAAAEQKPTGPVYFLAPRCGFFSFERTAEKRAADLRDLGVSKAALVYLSATRSAIVIDGEYDLKELKRHALRLLLTVHVAAQRPTRKEPGLPLGYDPARKFVERALAIDTRPPVIHLRRMSTWDPLKS